MAPVYASDLALPRRPQDSVPACPLRLWPGETLTHKSSSASPNALRQVQQIGHGKRTRLKSGQGTSLCSIGNDHPFVPTCRLAERRRFESCCTHHQNQNLAGRRPEQKGRCPNLKVGRFSYLCSRADRARRRAGQPQYRGARPAIRASSPRHGAVGGRRRSGGGSGGRRARFGRGARCGCRSRRDGRARARRAGRRCARSRGDGR